MRLKKIEKKFKVIKDGEFLNLIKLDEIENLEKCLTFSEKKLSKELLSSKKVTSIICKKEDVKEYLNLNIGIIESNDPKNDFFEVMNYLSEETDFYYRKRPSEVSEKAVIAENVYIDSEDVRIEEEVVIDSGSVIKKGSIIKKGAYIGPNTVIGAESFSYFSSEKKKVLSSKRAVIEENVHLLGGVIVEKGVHRDTVVGKNTKVAVGSIIEHDTIIEDDNMICAGVVIAGRVKVEKSCYIGPNSTLRNNIVLGEKTTVSMGSVVTKSTVGNERVTGNFAISHNEFLSKIKASKGN